MTHLIVKFWKVKDMPGAHHQPKKSSLARILSIIHGQSFMGRHYKHFLEERGWPLVCDTAGCVTAKNCTLGFLLLHCCFMVIDWEGKSCTLGFARSSDEAALLKNCCFTAASLIIRDCNFCSPCICSASCCFIAASCKSESATFPLPIYDHEAAMKQQKSESAIFAVTHPAVSHTSGHPLFSRKCL